jgi:Flagellar transcriptional activator (FlhC)
MRVSDDRYARDRQRFDLAERLIRHEARTLTIRQWTGLSDDRIRKLYRSYCLDHDTNTVLRHRGKSPRQAAFFFKNPDLNFHAAQLASLYFMYGLLQSAAGRIISGFRLGSLESGALLCGAYEAYRQLHNPASISFEHAWFLLFALARHDEVGVSRCVACGGVQVRDLLARRRCACPNCSTVGSPGDAEGGEPR